MAMSVVKQNLIDISKAGSEIYPTGFGLIISGLNNLFVQSVSLVWLFCDPMDCSTPGFPVLQYLLEFAQIHVHLIYSVCQFSKCQYLYTTKFGFLYWIIFAFIQ